MAMPTMEHSRASPSVGDQGKEFVRNFFPPGLRCHIGIRLPFIRNEFLPAVAMKKIVEGCAAILPPKPSVSAFFALATTKMPPSGCLRKGREKRGLLAYLLPPSTCSVVEPNSTAESQRLGLPELLYDARFCQESLQRRCSGSHALTMLPGLPNRNAARG